MKRAIVLYLMATLLSCGVIAAGHLFNLDRFDYAWWAGAINGAAGILIYRSVVAAVRGAEVAR